ncbi:MAG: [FeFe] hydrogenase H-cluster radical SAM maturase HydG [Deltaproteobacteria bacterium]|nr:[FeFe] hydrogenase H-cluster radical SAM maturase HydG [Deltaproteobacteria bacterium]
MDFSKIERLVKDAVPPTDADLDFILEKALVGRGLTLEDAAALLSIVDAGQKKLLYASAKALKVRLFGARVVLFAPLYLSNRCVNSCVYCAFSAGNKAAQGGRRSLTPKEAAREARAIEAMGFKRILLVTGEDPALGLDYLISCVNAVYENTGIRIIHVNAPPMEGAEFKALKAAGVGVYQSFQETYHEKTYARVHPGGKKRDFAYRLSTMDRALSAGFNDVGMGPLLGLYDYKYECLSAISHSTHLYEKFGTHAHTVSIPRLRPALGAALKDAPCPVTDEELKKSAAVLRLAIPPAGIVVSTREPAALRAELLHCGATQLSAGSRTNPGGYAEESTIEQFSTNDKRSLSEVMTAIAKDGFLPSLCTTCYRVGRVGHEFTEKTVSGGMAKLCQANAILTLKEYISDVKLNNRLSVEKDALVNMLASSIEEIEDQTLKKAVLKKLKEIDSGKRDLYF